MNHHPKNKQSTPKNPQPATLTTSLRTDGSTVFKFNRSEKKWKEKGSGDVTFSLKLKSSGADIDQLVVSVGKLSFIVQGGVRPKGSKAIVMRGKEVRDVQGEAIILAVRFEHEQDSRSLFQMLANTPWIRPQRGSKRPSKPRTKSRRRFNNFKKPPPNWFMETGTREQENIRALVSNAQVQYLEDGTIQRQLATIYKLTPEQIEQAIDFFQPWLKLGAGASGGSRSFSIGTRTDASLPSIHTAKLEYSKQIAPLQRVRSPKPAQQPSPAYPKGGAPPLGSYPQPAAPDPPPEAKQDNPPAQSPPSPSGPNQAARVDNNQQAAANNMPNNSPAAQANRRPPGNYEQNTMYESNARSSRKGSRLPIIDEKTAPLTAQNLLLHNQIVIPIKGDFRASVTTWLRKTHGPNPDDPTDGL